MDSGYGDEPQPREHRVGAWILLIIGVTALGLGIFRSRASILKPFVVESQFKTEEQLEQERLDELKTKDTDGDGITDFDESYVFETSPYLADSDSDGFSDKEELESGSDPNCPEGKECGPLGEDFTSAENTPNIGSSAQIPVSEPKLVGDMLNLTPEQIRALLIESGVSKEEVNAVDDETLTTLYRDSLQQVQEENLVSP